MTVPEAFFWAVTSLQIVHASDVAEAEPTAEMCDTWLLIGECDRNPLGMEVGCKGSCDLSRDRLAARCASWARRNACVKPKQKPFMMKHCRGVCDQRKAECQRWAMGNECEKNPAGMRAACGEMCDDLTFRGIIPCVSEACAARVNSTVEAEVSTTSPVVSVGADFIMSIYPGQRTTFNVHSEEESFPSDVLLPPSRSVDALSVRLHSLDTCRDYGPWVCFESDCPLTLQWSCDALAAANRCDHTVAQIWRRPPTSLRLPMWLLCPRACGHCEGECARGVTPPEGAPLADGGCIIPATSALLYQEPASPSAVLPDGSLGALGETLLTLDPSRHPWVMGAGGDTPAEPSTRMISSGAGDDKLDDPPRGEGDRFKDPPPLAPMIRLRVAGGSGDGAASADDEGWGLLWAQVECRDPGQAHWLLGRGAAEGGDARVLLTAPTREATWQPLALVRGSSFSLQPLSQSCSLQYLYKGALHPSDAPECARPPADAAAGRDQASMPPLRRPTALWYPPPSSGRYDVPTARWLTSEFSTIGRDPRLLLRKTLEDAPDYVHDLQHLPPGVARANETELQVELAWREHATRLPSDRQWRMTDVLSVLGGVSSFASPLQSYRRRPQGRAGRVTTAGAESAFGAMAVDRSRRAANWTLRSLSSIECLFLRCGTEFARCQRSAACRSTSLVTFKSFAINGVRVLNNDSLFDPPWLNRAGGGGRGAASAAALQDCVNARCDCVGARKRLRPQRFKGVLNATEIWQVLQLAHKGHALQEVKMQPSRSFGVAEKGHGPAKGHNVYYLQNYMEWLLPDIFWKLRELATLATERAGWGRMHETATARVVEMLEYTAPEDTPEKPAPMLGWHHDTQSVTTALVMLSDPSEFRGGSVHHSNEHGAFPTTLQSGDLLVYSSKHMHAVAPLRRGTRRVLVMEFWNGARNTTEPSLSPAPHTLSLQRVLLLSCSWLQRWLL